MTETTPSLPASGHGEVAGRRVRHKERGTTYEVLGEAEVQVSGTCVLTDNGVIPSARIVAEKSCCTPESTRLTVYRCEQTGKLWCRFADEFNDGRFENLASPTPSPVEARADGVREALALGQLESLVADMFRAEQEYDRARRLERGDRQSRDTVVRAERAYDKARFDLKRAIPKQLLEGDA